MAPPRFRKTQTATPGVNRNLDSVQDALTHQAGQLDYDRRIIRRVFLESAYHNLVPHGLKRVPIGVRVIGSDVFALIEHVFSGSNTLTMDIITTASGTFDLEVF